MVNRDIARPLRQDGIVRRSSFASTRRMPTTIPRQRLPSLHSHWRRSSVVSKNVACLRRLILCSVWCHPRDNQTYSTEQIPVCLTCRSKKIQRPSAVRITLRRKLVTASLELDNLPRGPARWVLISIPSPRANTTIINLTMEHPRTSSPSTSLL